MQNEQTKVQHFLRKGSRRNTQKNADKNHLITASMLLSKSGTINAFYKVVLISVGKVNAGV